MKTRIVLVPGREIEVEFSKGESIEQVLKRYHIEINFENQALPLGGVNIEAYDIRRVLLSKELLVIASGARGEAPTPLVKSAIKYLIKHVFTERGGKGDHRKFTNDNGDIVVLNPAKNDHKHLDLGSSKSLATFLEVPLRRLPEELN